MDVHNTETRSYNMSQIKGKNTRPEMLVRRFLHSHGFRYSLHSKKLPGKPDIVLSKYKTIIDVRGCFWHLHDGCKYGDRVSTASQKITLRRKSAVKRDQIKVAEWKKLGWNVIVVWAECELEPRKKNSERRESKLNEIKIRLIK
ncbi:DNA mismatch endonuclease Vsr [bacterium SCSIO 12643]|nr:DNA mismatch endonuclease Vsr [bacterium SCSIO 12643]